MRPSAAFPGVFVFGGVVILGARAASDRQMDNAERARPARRPIIEDVVDQVRPGQLLKLDVVSVAVR